MSSVELERLVVCDASPLILLAKIGRLDLIRTLAVEVIIPMAVREELLRDPTYPESGLLRAFMAESQNPPLDEPLEMAYRLEVDAGEAAALAYAARHEGTCLLMDDAKGRRVAKLHGFRCIGTLGWMVKSKRAGLITEVAPLLAQLKLRGLYVDDALVRLVLTSVGE